MPKNRFASILQTLNDHGVDFIVVGGVAAVLQGAPVSTFDVDVVHSTAPDNVTRLLAALERMDAYYRIQPERRLRPDATHLSSPGHQLLATRFGPLDLLGVVGKGRSYPDLLADSLQFTSGRRSPGPRTAPGNSDCGQGRRRRRKRPDHPADSTPHPGRKPQSQGVSRGPSFASPDPRC